MRVLVIEDDISIGQNIKDYLEDNGYIVEHETDGYKGFFTAKNNKFDIIVLDLMLPGKDGISIARDLRTLGVTIPIIMLTAKDSVDSKIEGFDSGADDYLIKPFSLKELNARIQSITRRVYFNTSITDTIEIGKMKINLKTKELFVNGKLVELTKKEYQIVEYLMRNKNKVVSKKEIEEQVWGLNNDIWSDVVRVHIQTIRSKIGDINQNMIITVRGLGFKIIDNNV